MKEIELTNGGVALVDDEDYEYLSGFKWRPKNSRGRVTYAQCHMTYTENGRRISRGMKMHQLLMIGNELPEIDHVDGNGLNNQKSNLRGCTRNQNMRNIKWPRGKSGYIGVLKRCCSYYARIHVNDQLIRLGHYKTAEEAARVRDAAAVKFHGEFAVLNFPKERP